MLFALFCVCNRFLALYLHFVFVIVVRSALSLGSTRTSYAVSGRAIASVCVFVRVFERLRACTEDTRDRYATGSAEWGMELWAVNEWIFINRVIGFFSFFILHECPTWVSRRQKRSDVVICIALLVRHIVMAASSADFCPEMFQWKQKLRKPSEAWPWQPWFQSLPGKINLDRALSWTIRAEQRLQTT